MGARPVRGGVPGRATRTVAAVLLVTIAMVSAEAIPAQAAPAWTISPSPNPDGPPMAHLSAVDCTSATSCVAVGDFVSPSGLSKTLIESWNGSTWSRVDTPSRVNASSVLAGVECPSVTLCFAVGHAGSATLIERWNGTVWSIVASPSPSGATSSAFSGVACTSVTDCFAVGHADAATLIERWNGTVWSIVASPSLGGASSNLAGVSCASTTSCFAVGNVSSGVFSGTLVERWDAGAWSIVASPSPSGADQLAGVSCVSDASCFAVGKSSSGFNSRPLVERWDGTSWMAVATPNPSDPRAGMLAVSCTSAATCSAVGGASATLTEQWNGTSWSIVPSPNRPGTNTGLLAAVSCPDSATCFAAGRDTFAPVLDGFDHMRTLVEQWNGATWSIVPSPSPTGPPDATLDAVACPVITSCMAVGQFTAPSGQLRASAEAWDGSSWSIVTPPNPTGAVNSALVGVSCAGTTHCFAVGRSASQALIEQWNGTSWALGASPSIAGARSSELADVSCVSATECMAAGDFVDSTGRRKPLTERWNGTTWSLVPNAVVTKGQFFGVSCAGTTSCFAVGEAGLIERWNGTTWSIVPPPTTNASLMDVSCTSATRCVAVGNQSRVGRPHLLTERWNGTAWSVSAAFDPAPDDGLAFSELLGASCTSATNCFAVGWHGNGSTTPSAFIERWNGSSWALVTSPAGEFLEDVSCAGAASCFAVGANNPGVLSRSLVMRYS